MRALLVFCFLLIASCASAQERFIPYEKGEPAKPPAAFVEFCKEHHDVDACKVRTAGVRRMELSAVRMHQLEEVNLFVNRAIWQVPDSEHYAKDPKKAADHWSLIEDGFGDCEEFALIKRRLLATIFDWPPESLSLMVVWRTNEEGKREGHLVLVVLTTEGDYILDSADKEVRLWSQTQLEFVKMQVPGKDPKKWIYVDHAIKELHAPQEQSG